MIHALTDETYAILSTKKVENNNFSFYLSLLNHLYWVISVFLGVTIGYFIEMKIEGLEFVLTALFLVLTIEQIYRIKQWMPFIYSFVACIASLLLLPSEQMLLASM